MNNALSKIIPEPRDTVISQSDVARHDWLEQRQALEKKRHRSSPVGAIQPRWWRNIDPAIKIFERMARLSGLHGRGVANALDIAIKPISFMLPSLPASFDGYRILQISDPHLDLLPELGDRIVALLSGLSVDLLLLTGDYRDRQDDAPEPGLALLQPILKTVDAPDGHFAVLGNHDPAASVAILEAMGLKVLINQTATIQRKDDVLHLTGLDDVNSFYTEAAHAALRQPFEGCRVAAVHSPEVADLAARAGIELYLCGHTHGGQICLPWGGPLISHLRRYRAYNRGLWRHGDMLGYTSNGAGVTCIPLRYNCPPEMALITLRRPFKDLD